MQHERRSQERVRIRIGGTIGDLPRSPIPLFIVDVSAEGCGVETDYVLPDGAEVSIEIEEGEPLGARVAWHQGTYAGLKFTTPLSEQVLSRLREMGLRKTG